MTKRFYQHLRAPNSPNGNPQRLYVVYDGKAHIVDVIDEGYQGLPRELRDVPQLATVEIARSTYHAWLKEWRETPKEIR